MKKFLSIILCFSFLFSFQNRSYAEMDNVADLIPQLMEITGNDWGRYLRIETEKSILDQIREMEELNYPN